VVAGGLSALGAGLFSIGIPKNSILDYEEAVKSGFTALCSHLSRILIMTALALFSQSKRKAQLMCCNKPRVAISKPSPQHTAVVNAGVRQITVTAVKTPEFTEQSGGG